MERDDFIRLFLPNFVLAHFDITSYKSTEEQIDIYLDEKNNPPEGGKYSSKCFTPVASIQDFPIRGKRVFLHIRRRKWIEESTGKVISKSYDLSFKGTQLTQEFVAFLKETN